MSDFRPPKGFEDAKPAPRLPFKRAPETLLSPHGARTSEARARLARIADRAPEVLVKVNGRIHGQDRLRAHLDYISRKGELEIEDRDGVVIAGRSAVKDLADDWAATAEIDARRRSNTPLGLALVPSMPPGTDVAAVHDAARAFARESFERFDYGGGSRTATGASSPRRRTAEVAAWGEKRPLAKLRQAVASRS